MPRLEVEGRRVVGMYLSYEGAAEDLEDSGKGTVSLDGQEISEMVESTGTVSSCPSGCRWRLGGRQGDTV